MVTIERQDRLREALGGTRWEALRWVTETGSTNADLAASARRGDLRWQALVADRQSAGRGRRDRSWTTPQRAVLMSALLTPLDPERVTPLVPVLVGVAATEAAAGLGAATVGLKWPNDLVSGERKLAGILAEVVDRPEVVVAGIGINVTVGGDVPGSPVGLEDLVDGPVDEVAVAAGVLRRLDAHLAGLESDGPASLLDSYRRQCVTLGRDVRTERPDGSHLEGRATDVDGLGRLLVEDAEGHVHRLDAADVVHVR